MFSWFFPWVCFPFLGNPNLLPYLSISAFDWNWLDWWLEFLLADCFPNSSLFAFLLQVIINGSQISYQNPFDESSNMEFLSAECFPHSFLFCFPSLAHHINGSHLLKPKFLHLINLIWSFSQLNVFLIVPCLLSFSGWWSMDPNLLLKTPISILMNLIWSFSGLSVFLILPCLLSFSGWSSMDPNLLQKTPISEFDESDLEFSQLNVFLILPCFVSFFSWSFNPDPNLLLKTPISAFDESDMEF